MTKKELIDENLYLKQTVEQLFHLIDTLSPKQNTISTELNFCSAYSYWMESRKNQLQPRTYEGYRAISKQLISYFEPLGYKVHEVSAEHIMEYYQNRLLAGLSPNTIQRHHANLLTFFKYAIKQGWTDKNPMLDVRRPGEITVIHDYYSKEELEKLLKAAKDSHIYTAILFATLGLRRSEICALRWRHIDFANGTVHIREKAYKVNGEPEKIIPELKSAGSYRKLALPAHFLSYLQELRSRQQETAAQAGYRFTDDDFICGFKPGEPLKLNTVTQAFHDLLRKYHLRPIRFHDLRHTCATLMMASGYSLKHIQTWLGHSQISTTGDIYLHISLEEKQKIANSMDTFFINL